MSQLPEGAYRDTATHADPANFARRMKAYARQQEAKAKAVAAKVQPITKRKTA